MFATLEGTTNSRGKRDYGLLHVNQRKHASLFPHGLVAVVCYGRAGWLVGIYKLTKLLGGGKKKKNKKYIGVVKDHLCFGKEKKKKKKTIILPK